MIQNFILIHFYDTSIVTIPSTWLKRVLLEWEWKKNDGNPCTNMARRWSSITAADNLGYICLPHAPHPFSHFTSIEYEWKRKPRVLGVSVQEWRFIISLNELVSGLLSGSLPEGNAGVSYQVVLERWPLHGSAYEMQGPGLLSPFSQPLTELPSHLHSPEWTGQCY